uniref:Serpin domain-containing protein n=1 Tax=Timema poppense TaxID=170557 RepID=A0A7R9CKG7_TIMPO|nr:unnamed protein product [Timema poppensis]
MASFGSYDRSCALISCRGQFQKKKIEKQRASLVAFVRELSSNTVHPTEIRTSISPSSAAELQHDKRGGQFNLLIILPYDIDGLTQLENSIKGFDIGHITLYKYVLAKVWLPKFKLCTETDFKGSLEELGVKKLFHRANLSGILSPDTIRVDGIRQTALFDVSDETAGTSNIPKARRYSPHKSKPKKVKFKGSKAFSGKRRVLLQVDYVTQLSFTGSQANLSPLSIIFLSIDCIIVSTPLCISCLQRATTWMIRKRRLQSMFATETEENTDKHARTREGKRVSHFPTVVVKLLRENLRVDTESSGKDDTLSR